MFNYQSQFLTFIQFSSKILGIFSQKLVLVANGWHLWLSTTLIGIQEKCHRTTFVPSCLKLWNGQFFLKMTTGSLSHFVLMYLSCENNHLCSILSQVIKWEIFLLKINNCSLFYLVSRYEMDNLFENDQLFFGWSDNLAPDNLAPGQFGTNMIKRTIWHQEKNDF